MSLIPVNANPEDMATAEALRGCFEQLEVQFDQMREGLDHSHRLATLGTIAAIMAYEYNNILTPVISCTQLALVKEDDPQLMRKSSKRRGPERNGQLKFLRHCWILSARRTSSMLQSYRWWLTR